MPTNYPYRVIESHGTCATTGNPSISRTLSRHRTIRGAVRAWQQCAGRSFKIVDADGAIVHWETDERGRVFEVDAPAW